MKNLEQHTPEFKTIICADEVPTIGQQEPLST